MQQTSNPDRQVQTRRMQFEEDLAQVPKHFAGGGDIVTSHFWAGLSAMFPDGEDFFVKTVRHYRDQITDPVLKRQVAGFIGQEAMHGRVHRALNHHLATLGYPIEKLESFTRWNNEMFEKYLSPELCLAQTVVSEHMTALLAEKCLEDEAVRESLGHQAIRDLLVWHSLEESEHKAVAFDVYRAIGGSERKRVWSMKVMRWTIPIMAVQLLVQVWMSDKAARKPGAMRASLKRFLKNPLFSKDMWEAIKDFERPGFHPDQRNTDAMLAEWSERLFGPEGELNDKLLASAAV